MLLSFAITPVSTEMDLTTCIPPFAFAKLTKTRFVYVRVTGQAFT